jgi:DNA polymerase-3 subunit beta
MRFAVQKKDLLRVLGRCQGVADRKSTMPILGNVLVEAASPDQVRISATDLSLAVSGTMHAEIERPGVVAIAARELFERIRHMPEGLVSFEVENATHATIRSLGSARRYTLHTIPGNEFPSLPKAEEGAAWLKLDVDTLSRLIGSTFFSVSTDDTRPHLNSALFEWDKTVVRMVTTDGHRLSKIELRADSTGGPTSMLIPLKGLLELKRLCDEAKTDGKDDGSAQLGMAHSGPNAFFQLAGFQFSVKLVDAQFPPYQQVIPDTSERVVRAPTIMVADALTAVGVAASDRTGGVKLTLNSGIMRFESESPETGGGFDEVRVEYDGPELTVGFNAKYFLDVLKAITDDEILLGISGELDPAVIRPGTELPGSSYLAVIMPMRI